MSHGLFICFIFLIMGCDSNENEVILDRNISSKYFLEPIDSVKFHSNFDSLRSENKSFLDHRYGYSILMDSNNLFNLTSINSNNEVVRYNFNSGNITNFGKTTNFDIEAFKIDKDEILLMYNDSLHVVDFELSSIKSIRFPKANIKRKHDIDFSMENRSNVFEYKNNYFLLYYIVNENNEGEEIYANTDPLLYFFDADTSYFTGSLENDTMFLFQYFRYPVINTDSSYIYFSSRVSNSLTMADENGNIKTIQIDETDNKYLPFEYRDQYQISKIKKYRFSSAYNKEILINSKHLFLIREIPTKIYINEGIKEYETKLEVIVYDKELNRLKNFFIDKSSYSYITLKEEKLYLFNLLKQKYYEFEVY